ncbi:mucin-5AC-like [Branchiostoma lanceolatum]|uniref:mucin-5AC-like n=1 Tax=Branchiostoma lanceolatum TaxID=7740 RepID=UPI0034530382
MPSSRPDTSLDSGGRNSLHHCDKQTGNLNLGDFNMKFLHFVCVFLLISALLLESDAWWRRRRRRSPRGCSTPPSLTYTYRSGCSSPYTNGECCYYRCRSGYTQVSGSTTRTCSNGRWAGTNLVCGRTCSTPPTPAYTYRSGCSSPYTNGKKCYYRCRSGYTQVSGSTVKTCSSGRWAGTNLVCERIPCTRWTRWYDRDNPSGWGDAETFPWLRNENPGQICSSPSAIEARVRGTHTPASQTGETFHHFDTTIGFGCKNSDQRDRSCLDYEVRFCCPLPCTRWTRWYDRDNPSGWGDAETFPWLRNENPGQICSSPSAIEARVRGIHTPAYQTGETFHHFDTTIGFGCKNSDQRDRSCLDYEVRFCCAPCTRWTRWYDRDNPSGAGDWETLTDLLRENPGQICSAPSAIEARRRGTQTPASQTGETFYRFDTTVGFACRNRDQTDRYCLDYEVRFCCA